LKICRTNIYYSLRGTQGRKHYALLSDVIRWQRCANEYICTKKN